MRTRGQRGAALVTVMMLTVFLLAATLALVTTTGAEVAVVGAFVWGWQAQYAAEAAIHRALVDLRRIPDWTAVLNGSTVSSFTEGPVNAPRTIGGRVIEIGIVQSLATCGRLTPCSDEQRAAITVDRPWGANNPRWRPFAYGPLSSLSTAAGIHTPNSPLIIVLVGDDVAEVDGDPDRDEDEGRPGGGVLQLRAYAYGAGGARRTVAAVVARAAGGGRVRVVQWRGE